MCVCLHTKFQVSIIILTRFRQEGGSNFILHSTHTNIHTNTNTHTLSKWPPKSSCRLEIRVKDLTKMHNCSKFHQYRNGGCQGKNFQNFTLTTTISILMKLTTIMYLCEIFNPNL